MRLYVCMHACISVCMWSVEGFVRSANGGVEKHRQRASFSPPYALPKVKSHSGDKLNDSTRLGEF